MSGNISEEYRVAAKHWVEADAAASLMEECKTPTLSQMMLATGADSVSRSEMLAKASPEWKEYIDKMVEARRKANLLKVQLKWIEMKYGEQQSAEATARAERRL